MADPEKKPLKPPSRPRPLISFAYGVPESDPNFMGPLPRQPPVNAPLAGLAPYFEGGMDAVLGALGVRGDTLAPPGTAPPSWATIAGMAATMVPLKSLSGLGRGLYSRVDEALKLLPLKGAHPNKVLSILKSHASAEELAFRQVPEFLAAQGGKAVTPETLAAHLAAHPAPVPKVVTRGEPPGDLIKARGDVEARATHLRAAAFDDPKDWVGVSDLDRTNAHWWAMEAAGGDARALRKLQDIAVDPDHLETLLAFGRVRNESTALARQIEAVPTRKYQTYQVPGGENYRETLLTLPTDVPAQEARLKQLNEAISFGPDQSRETLNALHAEREALQHNLRSGVDTYRSPHWEEPNVIAHTRANERTLPTGERGRFVEEVQSDWHQAGKQKGYARDTTEELAKLTSEWEAARKIMMASESPESLAAQVRMGEITDEMNALHDIAGGVPDAPFKETWPDLGLKQQLLETAADPEAQWLGFTSGQTQAARYDLSKQISEVHYSGTNLKAYDHAGNEVISQTGITPEQLPDYIGKEAADKLLAQEPQGTLRSLTGVDLQTGGEGMQYFYDQLLRKRLEKIVKPFGGTVEKTPLGGSLRTVAEIDKEMDTVATAMEQARRRELVSAAPQPGADRVALSQRYDALQAERNQASSESGPISAWLARLSPEMKARIQREGLPLLSPLIGGIALSQIAQPRKTEAR